MSRDGQQNHPVPLAPAGRIGTSGQWRHAVIVPIGRRVYRSRDPRREIVMRLFFLLVAFAAGMLCGLYDLRTGHTAGTALFIAGLAFLFAAFWPAWALSGGIAIALGVPATYLVAMLARVPIPYPPTPHVGATLLALLPAVAAALLGMFLRRLFGGEPRNPLRP